MFHKILENLFGKITVGNNSFARIDALEMHFYHSGREMRHEFHVGSSSLHLAVVVVNANEVIATRSSNLKYGINNHTLPSTVVSKRQCDAVIAKHSEKSHLIAQQTQIVGYIASYTAKGNLHAAGI